LSVAVACADTTPHLDLAGFDGVIVGSSIIRGKHRASIDRFVSEHRQALNTLPTAFFSVSGAAASADATEQYEARRMMESFLTKHSWTPDLVATFGGAISYTRYSPLIRFVMKRISRKEGGPTDTTRDHELTDWARVDDFADHFAHVAAPVLFAGK
jgi:menaquinone-dependent protoporphyrinogen oxidase